MEGPIMDNSYNPFLAILEKLDHIESRIASSSHIAPDATYLKIDKAAEFLSTSTAAIRMMVHKEQIPHIKKQGKLYFLHSDLVLWLEKGRIEPAEDIPGDILFTNKKRS
jgi:hypothetical protein